MFFSVTFFCLPDGQKMFVPVPLNIKFQLSVLMSDPIEHQAKGTIEQERKCISIHKISSPGPRMRLN